MNAGKLHATAKLIVLEYESFGILEKLQELVSLYEQSVNKPGKEASEAFRAHYADTAEMLRCCGSNTALPSRRRMFETIGAEDYLGQSLLEAIASLISENGQGDEHVLAELQKLFKELQGFHARLKNMVEAFADLAIPCALLAPGDAEITLVFPEGSLEQDVESLEEALHAYDRRLRIFKELVGEPATSQDVLALDTPDIEITLGASPAMGAVVATAISYIVGVFKKMMDIQKTRQQLSEQNVPEDVIRPLLEYEKTLVNQELQNAAGTLVDQYYKGEDDGRGNELKNGVTQALIFLSAKLDHGVLIEVDANDPSPDSLSEGEDLDKMKADVETVKRFGRAVTELKKGDKPILILPEDLGANDNTTTSQATTAKESDTAANKKGAGEQEGDVISLEDAVEEKPPLKTRHSSASASASASAASATGTGSKTGTGSATGTGSRAGTAAGSQPGEGEELEEAPDLSDSRAPRRKRFRNY